MDTEGINYQYIIEYLRSHVHQADDLLQELEVYAAKHYVPIVQPEVSRLLEVLVRLKMPENILEIGTAIGYSAIFMAKASGAQLVTVERDDTMVELARKNIKRAGLAEKIKVIYGDAGEVLACLKKTYDFIFMDAAKGQYMEFLPQVLQRLQPHGLLVTDLVL